MPINKTKSINLLPQDEFQLTSLGRILKWALSTFRMMVIVTELIVMSAFLSRFWLDAKNSDLNEEINISKAQVLAYSDIEQEFRSYQSKLSIVKSLYSESNSSDLIKNITNQLPTDIVLSSIQKTNDGIQLKALSYSEKSIAQFLVNLESLQEINNIVLSQVASSVENNAITIFTITADDKQQKEGGAK